MRTLGPPMVKPMRPPAQKSSSEASSAERSGRAAASRRGVRATAHATATAIGGTATAPPKRMSQVCSFACSTEATGWAR